MRHARLSTSAATFNRFPITQTTQSDLTSPQQLNAQLINYHFYFFFFFFFINLNLGRRLPPGDIDDCIVTPIVQTQFTPLTEALCDVIMELTSQGQSATVEHIRTRLRSR